MGRLSSLAKMVNVGSSTDIIDYIISLLPADAKKGYGSEWTVNCQSCMRIEHGARNDTKHRGGFIINAAGFVYHCFNCDYACRYTVGQPIGKKCIDLFRDFGCSESQLRQLRLLAIANMTPENKDEYDKKQEEYKQHPFKNLPNYYLDINETINTRRKTNPRFIKCFNYLNDRNPLLLRWSKFYWSPAGTRDCIGIKNLSGGNDYGYILRYIDGQEPRFINNLPIGAIFNFDTAKEDRKTNILVEGVFDAISLNCLGLLGNEVTDSKLTNLKTVIDHQKLIYLPDRDSAGFKAVESFYNKQFPISISCPKFEYGIKDASEAVKYYGRPYTIKMILDSVIDNWDLAMVKAKLWCQQ